MPDALLGSGSAFDQTKSALGSWLRENLAKVRSLPSEDLGGYDIKFVGGWSVEVEHGDRCVVLHVLLDRQFPYSPIRIALKLQEAYLKWPHVERGGLLCLPRLTAPSANLNAVIELTIRHAITLIERCNDPNFVTKEFRREFVSYWTREQRAAAKPVRSLLNPTDQGARVIAAWFGQSFTLVGEHPDQIRNWSKNFFESDLRQDIAFGVFGFLDRAPAPPFPERPNEVFSLLAEHNPAVLALFDGLAVDERVVVVLGARSPTGIGLIGIRMEAPGLNGFRKGVAPNAAAKMMLWKARSQIRRVTVERFDTAWVHGRGLNRQQPTLEKSSVLVVGCGSLGSQVAVRLAQSGVGAIQLVDPQVLVPANVGRHALGINCVGDFKAGALAANLRGRFPHMRSVESFDESWQALFEKRPELFNEASLIIACLGEWGADGQLAEWQKSSARSIVYGWLDEHGVAAHAAVLIGPSPALTCILNEDGGLRLPETLWDGDGLLQAEPACGTLFQPYGAVDVAQAELLVSMLCIDVLTGQTIPPIHRVCARSSAQISDAGGVWSPEHLRHRPAGFAGPFEYERSVVACQTCAACMEEAA